MSAEVIQKLQDKATVLTQERKKRGRTIPEDLVPQDAIRNYKTLASHPVGIISEINTNDHGSIISLLWLNALRMFSSEEKSNKNIPL